MSETLIPTMGLRFIEVEAPAPFTMHTPLGGPPLMQMYRVLQQRFTTPAGSEVWQDVPLVQL